MIAFENLCWTMSTLILYDSCILLDLNISADMTKQLSGCELNLKK